MELSSRCRRIEGGGRGSSGEGGWGWTESAAGKERAVKTDGIEEEEEEERGRE